MRTYKLIWERTTKSGKIIPDSAHYKDRESAQRASDEMVANGKVDSQPIIEESEI